MKTRIYLFVLMIGMIMSATAQKSSITLTFTADNNSQHVSLDSILIENLTQGGSTMLYEPDTVLTLNYGLGISEEVITERNVFLLSQNYPNPMNGITTIDLHLPEYENILITVSDITGKEIIQQEYQLEQGSHTFTFLPGKGSIYFLTARADQQSQTIKMCSSPGTPDVVGFCTLEYNGTKNDFSKYKTAIMMNNFVFDLGDQLQYTASSVLGERTIIDAPSVNQTYTYQYGSGGAPCPGMLYVTDIDGNVYNTVLIGTQCWIKENLKTTTYRNGTSIPNVTGENAWSFLSTGAYALYYNDISYKEKYGILYNWFAAIDPNGLCPTGWHVPTNDDWNALTNYIGGTNSPHSNELKSCRQVNSPLGGGCNTSENPRWDEHYTHYGTDDYGFSGLPGGYRDNSGDFDFLGSYGGWWSFTEYSPNYAWTYGLSYYEDSVTVYNDFKQLGFSVRCLRD